MEMGIPLRVKLDGVNAAHRFLLDVRTAGLADTSHLVESSGEDHVYEPLQGGGLVFDPATGTAEGSVTILQAGDNLDMKRAEVGGREAATATLYPQGAKKNVPAAEAATTTGAAIAATGVVAGSKDQEEAGQQPLPGKWEEEICLVIDFSPEWEARFNRPVLSLSSLPACVIPRNSEDGAQGEKLSLVSLPAAEQRGSAGPALSPPSVLLPFADGPCNVRRLHFAARRHMFSDVKDRPNVGESGARREQEAYCMNSSREEDCLPKIYSPATPDSANKELRPSVDRRVLTPDAAGSSPTTSMTTTINNNGNNRNTTTATIELSIVESSSMGGYFGKIWDCSLALAAFLASSSLPGGPATAMCGKRVAELGAGCGVVSAVCAALGAVEVVATDTKDLVPLLRLNLDRNCSALGLRNVKVQEYNWGSTPIAGTPLAREDDDHHAPFDVILCSDLLYDPAEWPALRDSLFSKLGKVDDCVIYLAHRTRNPQEQEFFSSFFVEGGDGGGGRGGERGSVGGGEYRCRRLRQCENEKKKNDKEEVGRSWGQRGLGLGPTLGMGEGFDGVWRWNAFPDVEIYELLRLPKVPGKKRG